MKLSKALIAAGLIAVSSASFAKFDKNEKFDVKMKLFTPITITEQAALNFPDREAGSTFDEVVAPASGAQFDISGLDGETVNVSVADVTMTTGDGTGTAKQIPVDTWTYSASCAGGTATLAGGSVTCNLGATAHVAAEDIGGQYAAEATLTVGYQ